MNGLLSPLAQIQNDQAYYRALYEGQMAHARDQVALGSLRPPDQQINNPVLLLLETRSD